MLARMWKNENLVEYKVVLLLWFLKKLNTDLYDRTVPLLSMCPNNWKPVLHKYTWMPVHSTTRHSSHICKTAWMSVRWVDKLWNEVLIRCCDFVKVTFIKYSQCGIVSWRSTRDHKGNWPGGGFPHRSWKKHSAQLNGSIRSSRQGAGTWGTGFTEVCGWSAFVVPIFLIWVG